MHPTIFNSFKPKESVSDGRSVYDFLGGAIDATYKHGWDKLVAPEGKVVKPAYPAPTEWTVDWIASLLAAKLAGERFTVIELGAGYGQWMVSSIMAYKACYPDRPVHGMALEAEKTHYEWLHKHVEKNLSNYNNIHTDLLYAAAGYDGVVQFPTVDEPDSTYGASYQPNANGTGMEEVECLSMQSIDVRFGESVIDMLHVDVQGAEADLIVNPGFDNVLSKTRFALFGTHRSNDLHNNVKQKIEDAGMQVLIEWPRNSFIETPFGSIKTNDGAVLGVNANVAELAKSFLV